MSNKIVLGMTWHRDGHQFEVTEIHGDECKITETWLSEDDGHDCKDKSVYKIVTENDGQQYVYEPQYAKYANLGSADYSWWARMYACGADYIRQN